MATIQAIATPTVTINDVTVPIVPNSFTYTEGLGEQTRRTQSAGGASIQTVFSDNVEMKYSDVKFSIFPTPSNIKIAREWKVNASANVIIASDNISELSLTFLEAAIVNNYEVKLGTDTTIDLEFKTRAVIGSN